MNVEYVNELSESLFSVHNIGMTVALHTSVHVPAKFLSNIKMFLTVLIRLLHFLSIVPGIVHVFVPVYPTRIQ